MVDREVGMGRGKVFPAASAKSLLNPLRRLVQSAKRTVAAMELPPHGFVVEVGAGPGFFSPAIAAAVPAGHLVVADLQPEMLHLARERLAGRANVHFVVADAMDLPFRPGACDAVVLATMLGEVPEPGRCIAEARRCIAPDGVLVVAETRRDSDFIPVDRLTRLVAAAGFAALGRRGPRWQYVARFR
jgi:ubiquinone/menaquinone biosynthesis C-methylase UbiE